MSKSIIRKKGGNAVRTVEQIRSLISEYKAKMVASECGIKYTTLVRFLKGGETYHSNVIALNDFLEKRRELLRDE